MRVQSYRSAGNISYPSGDSNRRRFFSSTLRHETFYPPMGTATAIVCTSVHLCTETFRTPMGTATFSVIHRRTLRRNISYPYGDSNINGRAIVYPLVRNISYPYGDSNQVSAFYSKHPFSVTFHTPMGTATPDAYRNRRASEKHFIPLWGQKENRYVQLDISVFTLFAIVIHMLRRPYRAPF